MPKTQNFSEHLEESIARLGGHVEQHFESQKERNVSERELVKESVQTFAEEVIKNESVTPQGTRLISQQDGDLQLLPSYLQKEEGSDDVKHIVENLIEEALSHDLEKAIKNARKYSPFIEDAFHDALVDKLVPELRRRGILK